MSKSRMALLLAIDRGVRVVDGRVFRADGYEYSLSEKDGYKAIRIRAISGSRSLTRVYVHRLVAVQKFGTDALFSDGIQVRHLNNNSRDNSWSNISIGTAHDNAMDKTKETRVRCAINASRSIRKLSNEQMVELKRLRRDGWTYSKLMSKFGISSKGTMSHLCNNSYVT